VNRTALLDLVTRNVKVARLGQKPSKEIRVIKIEPDGDSATILIGSKGERERIPHEAIRRISTTGEADRMIHLCAPRMLRLSYRSLKRESAFSSSRMR
jgi:hypothetical protein